MFDAICPAFYQQLRKCTDLTKAELANAYRLGERREEMKRGDAVARMMEPLTGLRATTYN